MSRFLFYMGHPAHYHNFKHSINGLLQKGHEIKVVARGKDVLFDLLKSEDWDLIKFKARKPSMQSAWSLTGKLGMIEAIAGREIAMLKIARKFKPDIMIGTDLVITHVGKLLRIPSVVVNEDDSAAIPLMAKLAFPYATAILAPNCCDQSPANDKKIGYEGYHELAYLHPNYFMPDKNSLPEDFRVSGTYFLLRFASLHAHHDDGRKGITDELALEIISILEPHGRVFITSERPFAERLEKYRLPVHPSQMHQVMAHAALYIGDSQTMAAEAAVLGVPSIRFNDFVGELSYLEELENKYELTKGIRADKPDELLETLKEWVEIENLKEIWEQRRQIMLSKTVDVTPFWMETFEKLTRKKR